MLYNRLTLVGRFAGVRKTDERSRTNPPFVTGTSRRAPPHRTQGCVESRIGNSQSEGDESNSEEVKTEISGRTRRERGSVRRLTAREGLN